MKFDATNLKKLDTTPTNVGNIDCDIKINNLYFTVAGEPKYMVSGEFHYSRFDHRMWEDELLKMKAAGCNVIATYCFWNHHEYTKGNWNFEGDMNLKHFVSLCKKHGLYVILRMGPWCHGEVVLGGFPKYVAMNPLARTNNKKYLGWVKTLYTQYYNQTKDYFYPSGTIIAAQLENEYTGKYEHIKTLKDMAIEIGFKLPFFTATAWPTPLDDKEVLPMLGGYPEAPWTQSMKPLESGDKFKIMSQYHDESIGNDILKSSENIAYSNVPIAYCELGAGVQSTTHRRPIITVDDAYSLSLATIAKGTNMLGYYVFHGGRNPNFAPMQENRRTLYPNNLPLLTYDFQAPLTEYGYATDKVPALNLLHYFCTTFDKGLPAMQAVFSKETHAKMTTSIRVNEAGSGYHFLSAYERLSQDQGGDIAAEIVTKDGTLNLPTVYLKNGEVFFYPFNLSLGNLKFEYIIAQPYLNTTDDGTRHVYMIRHASNKVQYKCNAAINGREAGELEVGDYDVTEAAGIKAVLHIVLKDTATKLRYNYNDGKVYNNANFVYFDGSRAIATKHIMADDHQGIKLVEITGRRMKSDRYFYGKCKPRLYKLTIPKGLVAEHDDVKIRFNFQGDMAHIYVGDKVVADTININNDFFVYLSRLADAVREGKEIYIRTNAIGKNQKTYFEAEVVKMDSTLSLDKIYIVHKEVING